MKRNRPRDGHGPADPHGAALTPAARAALVRGVRAQHPAQPLPELRREDTATGSGRVRFAGLDAAPARPRTR